MNLDKKNKLLGLITEAIDGIQEEIKKANQGLETLNELDHLQFILFTLKKMKYNLIDDNLKVSDFKPTIARFVIDTWPLTDPLGNKICQIEYEYERLDNK